MTILVVFGTRPEAIKMAPLIHELKKHKNIITKVCVTGQHRSMLDQVLDFFDIKPDFDLNIMKSGQDLFDVTSQVLINMRSVILDITPDIILVHGDTTTAMSAALSGFYSDIKVGHVEAGLRTHNLRSPFPEELNRQLISKISDIHFVPTENSRANLLAESISENKIHITGNTVIDSLFFTLNRLSNDDKLKASVISKLNNILRFNWSEKKYILITGHRRENFGEGILNICKAIRELALNYKDCHFVYPVHLNPNVHQPVYFLLNSIDNVHLVDPLDYVPFVLLVSKCYLILTDSGGLQEEAPSLGKPVLVMRNDTERPEGVKSGTVKVIGSNSNDIIQNVSSLLDDISQYNEMSNALNPYGDGNASKKIVSILLDNMRNII